eukprot:TRINITY_DN30727_c0_g1_i1.p1 TRINITY_DN30727_c0_g1~~TRINITY_DN30727_c0_g1_i1.p1  ORF type:complete len:327 (+),score=88.44 TRINITY_DN30727_c0_g1_i1:126-983(+)
MLDSAALAAGGMGSSPMAGGRRTAVTIIKTIGGSPPAVAHPQILQQPVIHRPVQLPNPEIGWSVTVTADLVCAQRAFEAADHQRVMGSAWMLTEDYLPNLGKTGTIVDVNPTGAVRIAFPDGRGGSAQWFPNSAISHLHMPQQPPVRQYRVQHVQPGTVDFATAEKLQAIAGLCDGLPHAVLATTLRSVVEAYPNLAGPVLQSLQQQQLQLAGQLQAGRGSPTPSPPKGDDASGHGGESPARSPRFGASAAGLNPHSPPFQSARLKQKQQEDALRSAVDDIIGDE